MESLKVSSLAVTAAAVTSLLVSPLLTESAQACGGFWCSQSAPVNQAAEQIIFVDNPDDTVTAVIQIQYQGPSEKFAWLLPMPGVPEISVSSNRAIQNLQLATDPQYMLEVEIEGECMDGDIYPPGPLPGGGLAFAAEADASAGGGVTVEAEGSVGPYDYVVISLDPGQSEAADVALEWLTDNGYDLSGTDSDLLGPYLADGLNLLAFRLTKGNSAGSIRPVVLTYDSKLPMIPIRPTAVAAQNDMGIRVWVASDMQAIPKNYKSLILNEALINWFCWQCNYDQVITAAADQAGGQGFVTELAGSGKDYEEAIWSSFDEENWMRISLQSFADPMDAVWEVRWSFGSWDGFRDAVEATVGLPQGVSYDDFGRNPDEYRGMIELDVDEFKSQVYERVVKPVIDTQELLNSRPYLTRMYSTMSADEMTTDPVFSYNRDLADVSNVHEAKQYIECSEDVSTWEAPWRIELPQGGVIRGEGGGFGGPWPVALDSMPANLKIVQLSESGGGTVVEDNTGNVRTGLFDVSGTMGTGEAMPEMPATGVPIGGGIDPLDPTESGEADEELSVTSSFCAVSAPGRGSHGGLFLLGGIGLAMAWRRLRSSYTGIRPRHM